MKTHDFCTIAATTLGALTLCYISYYFYRKKRLQQPPKNAKWQFIGTVEEITIYPVRSGAPISLSEVLCKNDGLCSDALRDRGLILYDENDKSIYAGVYPKMLSITTEVQNKSNIVVKAPLMEPLNINLDLFKSKSSTIKRKRGLKIHLAEGELEHHKWFSKLILNKSTGLKLFLSLKAEFQYNLMGEDISELMPVMVMNNVSVNDLNQRLSTENQAHHLQFRGNILIKPADNVKPYDEDNWSWLCFGWDKETDGKCMLRYRAPCLRCILTNVNINTYKRNPNFEPLKTLKRYRTIHNSKEPTLGAYYKVYQEGFLRLKDPVYAVLS